MLANYCRAGIKSLRGTTAQQQNYRIFIDEPSQLWGGTIWAGYLKYKEVKTGFCHKRYMQTGSSETLFVGCLVTWNMDANKYENRKKHDIYMVFRPVFCTESIVELMETLSKWNITVQAQERFVTLERLKYPSFCDIYYMYFTRLTTASLATATFNYAAFYHFSEVISTGM